MRFREIILNLTSVAEVNGIQKYFFSRALAAPFISSVKLFVEI